MERVVDKRDRFIQELRVLARERGSLSRFARAEVKAGMP
jgi:hypothetical protein